MFDESARAFLQQPLTARLAVNDPDGFPHVIPVWFMLDGDEIVMISGGRLAKVRYLEADGRAAVVIGGDPGQDAGYMIKGEITVSPDTGMVWTRRLTFHYELPEQAEKDVAAWEDLDMRVLRLRPVRVYKVA